MEQTSSRVYWREHNVPKSPGQMRAMSYQAVARGASGVLFFQWRASRVGAERFHSAMLSHSGEASPVWGEIVDLGRELAQLQTLGQAQVAARVAVAFSWQNWWAVEAPAKPANDLVLTEQLAWLYRPLFRSGTTVDFCRPDERLGGYEVVLVPSLYLVTPKEGANLVSFVQQGGNAVISFWSGIVDEHETVYPGPYGGPLRPLIGCDVLEVAPLPTGEAVEVEWEDGTKTTAAFWTDIVAETSGHVLARIASGPWAGRPAVIENRVGSGRTYYLTTRLDPVGLARVYSRIPALAGEASLERVGEGVERVVRTAPEHSYEFLINHSPEDREVDIAAGGFELLARAELGDRVKLPPMGVAIVRRPTGGPN
jgi:beta-galactosidase